MRSLTSKQWLPNCEEDKHGGKEKGDTIRKQVSHLHMAQGCFLSVWNSTSVQNKSIKKRHLKKCNQKCLGCRDSEPAFIFSCTNRGFLPTRRRQEGRHSANATRHPCFVEITIIVTHVWKYYVCEELLPVSLVISWLAKNRAKCWSEPADLTQRNTKENVTSGTMSRYFKTTSENLPSETDSECTLKRFIVFSLEKYFPH